MSEESSAARLIRRMDHRLHVGIRREETKFELMLRNLEHFLEDFHLTVRHDWNERKDRDSGVAREAELEITRLEGIEILAASETPGHRDIGEKARNCKIQLGGFVGRMITTYTELDQALESLEVLQRLHFLPLREMLIKALTTLRQVENIEGTEAA